MAFDSELRELARRLSPAARITVLTGAGVSAASGVPTFRGPGGLWRDFRPEDLATAEAFARDAKTVWEWYDWRRQLVAKCLPNRAHEVLALWSRRYESFALVTQNVDGLHSKAGSRGALDLHGRLDVVECLGCGARVARDDVQELLAAWNGRPREEASPSRPDGDARPALDDDAFQVPDCRECGGVLKPHVVFFGESVPPRRVTEAWAALREADALLVVGSSLMVYSGYRFVVAASENGLPVAAVNLGRTRADPLLSLKVEADCAAVLQHVAAAVQGG